MTQSGIGATLEISGGGGSLSGDELRLTDAYWRANYLSVGQIYLLNNPLLAEPLKPRARQAAACWGIGGRRPP